MNRPLVCKLCFNKTIKFFQNKQKNVNAMTVIGVGTWQENCFCVDNAIQEIFSNASVQGTFSTTKMKYSQVGVLFCYLFLNYPLGWTAIHVACAPYETLHLAMWRKSRCTRKLPGFEGFHNLEQITTLEGNRYNCLMRERNTKEEDIFQPEI